MKKLLVVMLMLSLIFGCDNSEKKTPYQKPLLTMTDSTYKADLAEVAKVNDSLIKDDVMSAYKKGWMDGSNAMIELHNKQKLTDANYLKVRNHDWRNNENYVNSIKP